MLAVLPFENLTSDSNKEYLADGLTEETISQLGRLNPGQLGVIARTSVMGYKHKGGRRMHYLRSSVYATIPHDRFWMRLRTTRLAGKRSRTPHWSELIAKYPYLTYQIAEAYAFRNQPEDAFEWLDRGYAQRDSGLIGTKTDPLLKSLHNDSRYSALLKKLNLPN
jgi:hypothetical protein